MSSVRSLRDFISQRLTAAAEEIFTEFEKTIVHYEEEIDRQRRLLDITWRAEINTNTTDLPRPPVCKEEEVLWNQQRSSRPDLEEPEPEPPHIKGDQKEPEPEPPHIKGDQKEPEPEPPLIQKDQQEPEPPRIKEEQQEVCSSQLVLKQETDAFTDQDRGPIREQLHSQSPPLTERTNQEPSKNLDSGSSTDVETSPDQRGSRSRPNVDRTDAPQSQISTQSGRKSLTCDVCGKICRSKHDLLRHYRVHTGERPYTCKVCGKRFSLNNTLLGHMRTHTGERPFSCRTCGKSFARRNTLLVHMRIHTGERPYACEICGKGFTHKCSFKNHLALHTADTPYS